MKIAIMCPGSFTFGLDSPERGESRWAQNYAKMLAMAGHDVYAASMGRPEPTIHYGCKLTTELQLHQYEPYDLYIDSSWWKDKVPKAKATKYICLKWSLEEYTREFKFPDNFYLAYPYPSHYCEFQLKSFNGRDKCYCLPTMFGTEFPKPNWQGQKIFLPGKIDTNRNYKPYLESILNYLNAFPVEGCSRKFLIELFGKHLQLRSDSNIYELKPYNEILNSLSRCRVSMPILNPGAIIEAAFMGVPSLFWEEGGFYNPLAKNMGVLIEHGAPVEWFTTMMDDLLLNKKRHWEVTRIIQDYFSSHLYRNAIEYFNMMIESIF